MAKKSVLKYGVILGIVALVSFAFLFGKDMLKENPITGAIVLQELELESEPVLESCNQSFELLLMDEIIQCKSELNTMTIDNNACQVINQKNSGTVLNMKVNLTWCEESLAENEIDLSKKEDKIDELERDVSAYLNLSQTDLLDHTHFLAVELSEQGFCTEPENEFDYSAIESCLDEVVNSENKLKVIQNLDVISGSVDSILSLIK